MTSLELGRRALELKRDAELERGAETARRVIAAQRATALALAPAIADVLAGAARGETIADTAARRVVSPLTVKTQRRVAIRELEARSITHAVALAKDSGAI
jgi:DNA-binding NarL/FixJ family response regulator